MKKLITVVLVVCLGLFIVSGALAADIEPLKETTYAVESYDGYEYYYVAFVKNVTDEAVNVRDATMTLFDAEGNEIGKANYLSDIGSTYLDPEEITAVMFRIDIDDPSKIADKKILYNTEKNASYGKDSTFEVASSEYMKVDSKYEDDGMHALITNTEEKDIKNLSVALVLVDKDGNPLYMRSSTTFDIALLPGSSIRFEERADRDIVDVLTANGMEPVGVEAMAYLKVDD